MAITTTNNNRIEREEERRNTFPTEQTTHANSYVEYQCFVFLRLHRFDLKQNKRKIVFFFEFDNIQWQSFTMSSIFKIDRTVSVAKRIALTETSSG